MEERELTRLLRRAGDQVTPGPPPLARIVAEGRSLGRRRTGRVRVFAVAAAAAAVVGGGSVAAVVLDLPSGGDEAADSAAGQALEESGGAESGGEEAAPTDRGESGADSGGADSGAAAVDAAALAVTPGVAAAGGTVELMPSDGGAMFGRSWRLEVRTADGWTSEYTLLAGMGPGGPTWAPAEEVPLGEQALIPAPVTLVIPPTAGPGDYRICQADGAEDRCGFVTVTG